MISTPALPSPARYVRHDNTPVPGHTTYAYPLEAVIRLLTDEERQDYALGLTGPD